MKKIVNAHLILLLVFCAITSISAQAYNSPYSRFGLGDLTNSNFMLTRAMGSTGSSYADNSSMNPVNPASYSWLTLASYNVGFFSEYAQIQDDIVTEDRWTGNLEYLGIAFPLRNYKNELLDPSTKKYKLGMAFFARPESRVSYDVTTREVLTEDEDIDRRFFGTGGTYSVNWGNSIRFSNLSIGVNLGYLFGNINNNQEINIVNESAQFIDEITNEYSVAGFKYEAGIMYKYQLNKKQKEQKKSVREKYLMFGLHGHVGQSFTTSGEFLHVGTFPIINGLDTINQSGLSGTGFIPAQIGFGVNFVDGRKANVGVNVNYSPYSSFENSIRPEQEFRNTLSLGLGGKYTPDARGFGSFLERTSYTFGLFYNQDPRIIQDQELDAYGINLGLSMPFFYQQNYSRIHVNIELGQRGVGSIISENYAQIGLGLNFNDDSWFIRRKYN